MIIQTLKKYPAQILALLGIIFLLLVGTNAKAEWTQTGDTFTDPKYEGLGPSDFECNSGGYPLPFDCAVNPDVTATFCAGIRSTNASGYGAYINNVPSNIDVEMFLLGDFYLDFTCTGTTLTQFDVYAPPTPSWYSTSTGTTTSTTTIATDAPYLPSLNAIVFFMAFWSTMFLILWKRN